MCIMGRLTADPELRATLSGTSVCTFTIACNRPAKSGEEAKADFLDIVTWRGTADFVNKWFSKGDAIIINGRLQTRLYEDKNGNKRKAVEVIAEGVNFAGSKNKEKQSDPELMDGFTDIDDEQLPFN